MAGYRDSLNLPRTDFPMKADLPKREPQWLERWEAMGLYAKLRQARHGRPLLLLHDGPPYSNGHLHMGTASNKIWKDALVRSASVRGFDSPYLPGWDNHGMPIEIRVSKEFREQKVQPDRLMLRRRCREYAAEWVDIQRREFQRLGVWGEWMHPYLTMEPGFEGEIVDTFALLAERGYIQRGLRAIHWCPTDRTALAEAEIEYADIPSPSIYVRFPLRDDPNHVFEGMGPVDAVAWTTTPWTLPANLGLMVDPGAPYVVVRAGGGRFLVAEPRLPAVAAAVGWEHPEVERRLPGRDLPGLVFTGPWDNASHVVDGTPFVSMEDGTGLVHTAPGHGKEDFTVGLREGLGVVNPVDEAGRFLAGAEPFVGRSVLEVDGDIIAWIAERGRLLAKGTLTHSYPHCWRCHNPVIFRATRQWFMMIDHMNHRDRALDAIESRVRWEPEGSKNRIRDAVRQRPDWCLSRQRSWGVGIPAVYCESCDAGLLDPRVMARAAALTREHGSDAWYELAVERFLPDAFTCSECGATGPFRKETDILDVWFDSGSTHRAVQATRPHLAEAWKRALAGGRVVYFEGPDQHRGWFNSSLMVGIGAGGHPPFTDVLTHGWVLDFDGRAMHKSLGNVVAPDTVIAKYGADIVRWWALATDWRNDVRIGDEILQRVADAYRKVRNTFRFLLGNLADFDPAKHTVPIAHLTAVDRAFASHLAARIEHMREDYERFLFHRVADAVLDVCTVDLSAVFLDVAKDRLYTLAPDDPARRSAQTVLWMALHDLVIAASPILAFTADEVWNSHPGLLAHGESVHLALWPEGRRELIQEGPAGEDWVFLLDVRTAVNAAIEPLRAAKTLATTQEAEVVITAPTPVVARLERFREELVGLLLVARAEVVENVDAGGVGVEVAKTAFVRCDRCWTHRPDVATSGPSAGLCYRCLEALAAAGRVARPS